MTVAAAFDRAADYDRHAIVQRQVAEGLAARIAGLRLPEGPRLLEIGCGTGLLGEMLVDRLPGAHWLMTDIAPAMVARARARFARRPEIRFAVMDGERPDAEGPYDLICSSLAAQWFADLPGTLARWRDRLGQGGRIAFTTLAAGSFAEWRRAHGDLPCGLHFYPEAEALAALGLEVSLERRILHHADARDFLRGLKAIGAGTPQPGHRPLTPAQLRTVMARFEAEGATATYVVATCLGGAA
ncbi:methyltransferase [Sphingomonas sp. ASY06-1R]|jgi:malonyl-CoA O-methyltransferase|uniref:methyltransferase n=1 Tax=Sphingomonas sp. ASY06-1R TaxID=3445771 RepID=UPI003FA2E08C